MFCELINCYFIHCAIITCIDLLCLEIDLGQAVIGYLDVHFSHSTFFNLENGNFHAFLLMF